MIAETESIPFNVGSSTLEVQSSAPSPSPLCALRVSAVKSGSLLFCVPDDDGSQSEFNSLPAEVRDDVDRALLALERIHTAAKRNPEIKQVAAYYCGRRGFTFNSLRAKYYWYTSTGKPDGFGNQIFPAGDWRILVDYSRVPARSRPGAEVGVGSPGFSRSGLSPDFIEYLKGLYGSNQRKSEPAIRKLYALWRAGESIPGYGTWQEWFQDSQPHHPLPEHCPPQFPRGWHKSNLRKYIPDDAELALSRHGKAATLQLLPPILQTREGLRPLEYIEFDDFRTDFKVLVPGYASPVELNGLVAIDVATGRPLRYGLRAAIPREDGMKDKLKLHDMKVLIAGILLQYGVPINYVMHLIVENATATVRDAFALALAELFRPVQGSKFEVQGSRFSSGIVVEKTQIIQGTALWSGYKDKPGGNPRGKPHVESTFNLFHNEAGFEKGQIGRRYDAGPADLHGRTRETESLGRVARHLTPHQRAALKMPFLNYSEARLVCTDIWNRIYQRTDHQMEAFQVIGEFRINSPSSSSSSSSSNFSQWIPDGELVTNPEYALIPRDRIEWRNPARKESPAERWERLCHIESQSVPVQGSKFEVQGSTVSPFRIPHASIIARLYDEHKLRPVTGYQITFDHDKQNCVYRLANLQFARPGSSPALKEGCQVLCYFDPQDLSIIHLTDGKGGYLGSIPRTRGIRKTDKEGLKADYERKQAEYQKLKDTVSSRLPEQAEQRLEEIDANCEVLKQALENADVIPADTLSPTLSPTLSGPSDSGLRTQDSGPSGSPVPVQGSKFEVQGSTVSGSVVADSIAAVRTANAVQVRQAAAERARVQSAPRSLKSILAGHEARTT